MDPRFPERPATESSVPGAEAPAWESPSGRREQVLLAQPNTLPAGAHTPVHPCPRGARRHSPPTSSRGTPPCAPHPGDLRARPLLTLCCSRPSPQRPPGLRSLAAGVGVGGAGRGWGREGCPQAGRTKASLAWLRPIQRSAALPPPLRLPARSLKAERQAVLSGSSRRGTGNDLSRLQPPTSPHRWAGPWSSVGPWAEGSPRLLPGALCGGRTSCHQGTGGSAQLPTYSGTLAEWVFRPDPPPFPELGDLEKLSRPDIGSRSSYFKHSAPLTDQCSDW